MKVYIRTIQAKDEHDQRKKRDYLNNMGFYVLTLPCNRLEVNAISEEVYVEDKVCEFIGGVMSKINEAYDRVRLYCKECRHKTEQVIESSVTVCTECNVRTDSDADEIFGKAE